MIVVALQNTLGFDFFPAAKFLDWLVVLQQLVETKTAVNPLLSAANHTSPIVVLFSSHRLMIFIDLDSPAFTYFHLSSFYFMKFAI